VTAVSRIAFSHPPRIIVVALRRLGDVLLTTPLIRSLRSAWPDATIDALVFADTAGILADNPDVNGVVTMPDRPSMSQSAALAMRLWRKYDLAISTQCGDRPTFFALVAGCNHIAPVEATANGRLKRAMLDRSIPYEAGVHRVEEILRLADALGIARVAEVVAPSLRPLDTAPNGDYAVIHAAPMFRYKQWNKSGWRALAAWFSGRGLKTIATGGPAEAERRYLDEVWDDVLVHRVDGRLDWSQLAALLSKARIFVGPDTSVTHLAAAAGCPTVALYGPTDPRLWGPWPTGGLEVMWKDVEQIQNRSNVWLVQNPLPCTPCQLEGCERRLVSYSACLDELPVQRVIAAADEALRSSHIF
jgi:heptosyltransferase III